MKRMKKVEAEKASPKLRPTLTETAREKRLLSLALDIAEQRLLDGTASSQLVTAVLRRKSTEREQLELEILGRKRDLLTAQKESIESAARIEEMYAKAIEAMRHYSVRSGDEEDAYQDL